MYSRASRRKSYVVSSSFKVAFLASPIAGHSLLVLVELQMFGGEGVSNRGCQTVLYSITYCPLLATLSIEAFPRSRCGFAIGDSLAGPWILI